MNSEAMKWLGSHSTPLLNRTRYFGRVTGNPFPASITTLVLFIPFSGIDYIISSVECVALSETALGLRD